MPHRATVPLLSLLAIVTVAWAAVGAMPVLADEPATTSPSLPTPDASLTPSPSPSPSAEASLTPSAGPTAGPSTESTPSPTPVGEIPHRFEGSQGEGGNARDDAGDGSPRQAEGTASVAAVDDEFRPTQLTVTLGTTVVWTNQGQNPHTVTAADRAFDSGTLERGQTFSVTFEEAGEVPYYCQIHGEPGSGMRGVIVVQVPAEEGPAGGSPTGPPDVLAATGLDPMPLAIAALALVIAGLAAIRIGLRGLDGRR